ncbi:MAG: acyl-CoA dehydrogenase family protein [Candidatus Lambdaproteobacteria bacterium]|nr:acyl-CoA dehydrogenase family protein [Candidatus Lambdaproteobacteria bacterium]
MHLAEAPEYVRFRAEVREWIETTVPPSIKGWRLGIVTGPGPTPQQMKPLEDALAVKGWLAPLWPKAYGGAEFDAQRLVILEEEMVLAGIPPYRNLNGINMLGPILIRWGTEEQRARFLGPTLRREMLWSQGYSEPGAGSDLASLALRGEVVEGGFVLNGQKIWNSRAHFADYLFLLARTDPQARPRQKGISFLLVDRRSPGIVVRPLITMDGFHHFNQTFFENVFVPRQNLVGPLNEGWTIAKALLGYERLTLHFANPVVIADAIAHVRQAARETGDGLGGVLWDDPGLRRRVARLELDAEAMRQTRLRYLSVLRRGEPPGPATMIFKLYGGELFQRVVELHAQVLGPCGALWDGAPFRHDIVEAGKHDAHIRHLTIGGGTSEIHRNIIAKRILELPDEGRAARA